MKRIRRLQPSAHVAGRWHTFERWLKANAVVGFVLITALIAMALVGSDLARPDEAVIKYSEAPAADKLTAAGPHAVEATDPLYPGRYVATCKPGPMFGCVCEADSGRQLSIFPQFTSDAGYLTVSNLEVEYLRMIEWLRRTCQAVRNQETFDERQGPLATE
jgi:hypothetical protein